MPHALEVPASPVHALCVYAEPFVVGRRVVVFGDATGGLGDRLIDLGARLVHVYDADADRVAAAAREVPRGVTVQRLPAGEFDVRDGAFDVAIVPDLDDVPEPAALLGRVRRLLSSGGVALVRARNADAPSQRGPGPAGSPDYYELYDLMSLQFGQVRMVGELAWSGVALAQLGREGADLGVTVDTQLVTPAEPPRAYVAVGSHQALDLAEYALVQLPASRPADVEATVVLGGGHGDVQGAAQLQASLLAAQLERLRAERAQEASAFADARRALEADLADGAAELEQAERRGADAGVRADRGIAELRAREQDVARLRDALAMGVKEVDEERRLRVRLEMDLAAMRACVDEAAVEVQGLHVDAERAGDLGRTVAALESRVREATARLAASETGVRELTARLAASETGVRELTARLAASETGARELTARLAASETGARELTARLAASEQARAAVEDDLARAVEDLESARLALAAGEAEAAGGAAVAAATQRVAELEGQVRALEADLAAAGEGHGAEVDSLEGLLRERGRVAAGFAAEVARRERIIRDLLLTLEEARVAPGLADGAPRGDAAVDDSVAAGGEAVTKVVELRAERDELRKRLEGAALEAARREADRQASDWRIQELEQQVSRLEAEQTELTLTIPPPAVVMRDLEANDPALLSQQLAAAEDELELLRRALAQEHAARVRAEAGTAVPPV